MDGRKLTLTVSEAGHMLGISRNLAYQLVREGKIPAIRLGRRLVVPRGSLEHLLWEPEGSKRTYADGESDRDCGKA